MKTCLVITTSSQITTANTTAATLLELRTDLYGKFLLPKLVQRCTKPVIVTIKNQDKKLLQQALDLNVAYIDLDYKNKIVLNYFKKNIKTSKTKLIISYHNFKTTPSFKRLDELVQSGVNKIAVMINSIEDNWVIAQLLQKYPNTITAIGMGELGIMTRLHPYQRISYFGNAAPGQLSFNQRHLKLYGIIGHPVAHSLSPKLHNTWFKQKKILALYQRWDTQNITIMMKVFRFFNLAGASVTMPYKQEIKKYLDKIDPVAKTIGAVNTIVRRGKTLIGYNTDWLGVQQALSSPFRGPGGQIVRGQRVLILGKGGAGLAARYAVQQSGGQVVSNNNFDILINATPVRDTLLIPQALLHNKIVMDCNYGTKLTKLLQVAKQQGCITIDGLPMLIGQAQEQFQLWTQP